MSTIKITQLPVSSTLTGTEVVPIVQNDTTVQATLQDIADLVGGGETLLERTLTLTLNESPLTNFLFTFQRVDENFNPYTIDDRLQPVHLTISNYTSSNTIDLSIPAGIYLLRLTNYDDEIFDDGKSYRASVNLPASFLYVSESGGDFLFTGLQYITFDWNLNITQ